MEDAGVRARHEVPRVEGDVAPVADDEVVEHLDADGADGGVLMSTPFLAGAVDALCLHLRVAFWPLLAPGCSPGAGRPGPRHRASGRGCRAPRRSCWRRWSGPAASPR